MNRIKYWLPKFIGAGALAVLGIGIFAVSTQSRLPLDFTFALPLGAVGFGFWMIHRAIHGEMEAFDRDHESHAHS